MSIPPKFIPKIPSRAFVPSGPPKPFTQPLSTPSIFQPTASPNTASPKTASPKVFVPQLTSPKPASPKPVTRPLPKIPVLSPVRSPVRSIQANIEDIESNICSDCLDKWERKENPQQIQYLFVIRNGIKVNPIRNRNYTLETLAYMSSAAFSKSIVNKIESNLDTSSKTYDLVECCSGIGGDTIGFLDTKFINKVYTHEKDPIRRNILQNNLTDYKFDPSKYQISSDFVSIDQVPQGSIVYFDPPWIEQSISEAKEKCTCKSNYKEEGIKVSGKTLEQWMVDLKNKVALIVMKLPLKYKLGNVSGYDCHTSEYKHHTQVIVCKPKSFQPKQSFQPKKSTMNIPTIEPTSSSSGRSPPRLIAQPPSQPLMRQAIFKQPVTDESLTSEITLPEYMRMKPPSSPKLFESDPREWNMELQQQIYSIIAPLIIPDGIGSPEAHRKNILTPENGSMQIWIAAFTHTSWDRNINQNYERIEYIGDRALKTVFAKYLYNKFPGINEDQLSKLDVYYMSKFRQSQISQELGLPEWLRAHDGTTDIGVKEDLFESLFGAVMMIGDKIIGSDAGLVMTYNLISRISDELKIDFSNAMGDDKTQVKEILEKFNLLNKGNLKPFGSPQLLADGRWRFRSLFPADKKEVLSQYPEIMDKIRGLGFSLDHEALVDVTASSLHGVDNIAYTKLKEKLAEFGITAEFAELTKEKENNLFWSKQWASALSKARGKGYSNIELLGKPQTKKYAPTFIQVVGIKKNPKGDDVRDILYTKTSRQLSSDGEKGIKELKRQTLTEYSRVSDNQ